MKEEFSSKVTCLPQNKTSIKSLSFQATSCVTRIIAESTDGCVKIV